MQLSCQLPNRIQMLILNNVYCSRMLIAILNASSQLIWRFQNEIPIGNLQLSCQLLIQMLIWNKIRISDWQLATQLQVAISDAESKSKLATGNSVARCRFRCWFETKFVLFQYAHSRLAFWKTINFVWIQLWAFWNSANMLPVASCSFFWINYEHTGRI